MPANANPLVPFHRDRSARQLDVRFEELLQKLEKNRPGEDSGLVRRAYEVASRQHKEQTRRSGEPYLSHPLEVAHILADLRMDPTTLAAALLHDVVEDTRMSTEKVAELLGQDTARLVEGVTKISRIDLLSPEMRQAENVRKMLLAMVHDVRVVLVKLADRLHNMRTLEYLEPERQLRIARETMDLYAPIAHRLGMSVLRGELEDRAFEYLEPESFERLRREVAEKRKTYEKFLDEVQDTIRKRLVANGIPAEVEGRIKGLYSIHAKCMRHERPLEQIYDLLAVRVITDVERNCYAALGVVHQIWRPVPGRFKDYIAISRDNLYQSLHTTLIHGGQPFEVQIRTQEMHRIAEEGVAAHWKYKEGMPLSDADDRRIVWMRQLIEWSQEMQEPGEFLSTLKMDLTPTEIYSFTPKGKVLELPRGATPVDFAYAVHTEVGHQCVGAKVNAQMVSLRHEIANGDMVEILTQKGHSPSRDWLSFVKTSRAKSKIRHWISVHEREEALNIGRRLLEKEARHSGHSLKRISGDELSKVAADYGLSGRADDLLTAIGFGKISARQVIARLFGAAVQPEGQEDSSPALVKAVKRMLGMASAPLVVRGHDDLMVFRAKCCNPIPGEDITGYVTRGRGVAVHTRACPNVQNLLYQSERRIEVEWGAPGQNTFPVQLRLRTKDRPGMLADITSVIGGAGANIRELGTRPEGSEARIDASLEITDRRHLESILAGIRRIPGVHHVERVYRT